MNYEINISPLAQKHIEKHIKAGDKKVIVKISSILTELSEHPRNGIGKPEQLKGYAREVWSRRINSKHRLVYEIKEQELVVLALTAYGHYDDK